MSSVLQDLADKLAADALAAEAELGDERLVDDIAKILADTSSTTQEAFLTSVRIRRAEARARKLLEARIAKARGG